MRHIMDLKAVFFDLNIGKKNNAVAGLYFVIQLSNDLTASNLKLIHDCLTPL